VPHQERENRVNYSGKNLIPPIQGFHSSCKPFMGGEKYHARYAIVS